MRSIVFMLVSLLAIPAYSQAVWGGRSYSGRVCSSPGCRMCNSISAQLRTQSASRVVVRQQPTASPAGYHYETRRVKRCNGRQCWYETQRVLVRNAQPATATRTVSFRTGSAFASTPEPMVSEMLELVQPRRGEVVYDLGCGDGRILEKAITQYGASAVGIERNESAYQKAKSRLSGLKGWRLVSGDATKYRLDGADVVTMYLYHETIEKIAPKLSQLKPGARVVSYQHDIPGVETTKHTLDGNAFYVHTVPVAETFRATPAKTTSTLLSR